MNSFRPVRADSSWPRYLGLKPQAESSSPFGTRFHGPFDEGSPSPDELAQSLPFHELGRQAQRFG
jgi:hypothetical protein